MIDWLRVASFAAMARRCRLSWDQVAGIQERAVRRGLVRGRRALPRGARRLLRHGGRSGLCADLDGGDGHVAGLHPVGARPHGGVDRVRQVPRGAAPVLPVNPAAAVRGPKHVVTKGRAAGADARPRRGSSSTGSTRGRWRWSRRISTSAASRRRSAPLFQNVDRAAGLAERPGRCTHCPARQLGLLTWRNMDDLVEEKGTATREVQQRTGDNPDPAQQEHPPVRVLTREGFDEQRTGTSHTRISEPGRAACETPGACGLAQSSILLVNTHLPWIADWMRALEDRRHAESWK